MNTGNTRVRTPTELTYVSIIFGDAGEPQDLVHAIYTEERGIHCEAYYFGTDGDPICQPIAEREAVPAIHAFARDRGLGVVAVDADTYAFLASEWPARSVTPLLGVSDIEGWLGDAGDSFRQHMHRINAAAGPAATVACAHVVATGGWLPVVWRGSGRARIKPHQDPA
jgi:hypothetical protein